MYVYIYICIHVLVFPKGEEKGLNLFAPCPVAGTDDIDVSCKPLENDESFIDGGLFFFKKCM